MQMTWEERILWLKGEVITLRKVIDGIESAMRRTPSLLPDDAAVQLRREVLLESREIVQDMIDQKERIVAEIQEIVGEENRGAA
jgi:hypothetical protein